MNALYLVKNKRDFPKAYIKKLLKEAYDILLECKGNARVRLILSEQSAYQNRTMANGSLMPN